MMLDQGGAPGQPARRFSYAYFLSRSSSSIEMPCGPRMKQMRTPGPNGRRLLRELRALSLDLGGHRIDVFYRQPEMIEPLIGRLRRRVDAVAGRNRRDEHVGAAELDVDPPGATDDHAAEDIFKPGRSRLRVGTAQVDMIPGDHRHRRSPVAFHAPLARQISRRPLRARL